MYPILARLLMPVAYWWIRRKAQAEPEWGLQSAARRGDFAGVPRGGIWLHAASVGEVNSAIGLAAAVRQAYPHRPLLLTAFTGTGVQQWQRWAKSRAGVEVRPLPLDHPRWVERAVSEVDPCAFLVVETEIWPNLYGALHRRHVPLLICSARVSARSENGWQRWLGAALLQETLGPLRYLGAQSAADAKRFSRLGGRNVSVDGSLKWDAETPDVDAAATAGLHQVIANRRVWLAASTHPGEEEMVLLAHVAVRARHPNALLILAPRHPRRADEVEALCRSQGWTLARRTRDESPNSADVWLIDTLGELALFMTLAEVVFMGGSLVPIGGHNLLEPALLGRPTVTGLHNENAAEVACALEAGQGLRIVHSVDQLEQVVRELLSQPELARQLAQNAATVLARGRGALGRVLRALQQVMPPG